MPAMMYLGIVWSVVLSVLILYSSASDPCGYNPTVKRKSGVGFWSKPALVYSAGGMESKIDFYEFILCFSKNIFYFSAAYTTKVCSWSSGLHWWENLAITYEVSMRLS